MMKIINKCLILGLLIATTLSASAQYTTQTRIVGGDKVESEYYPWQVFMYVIIDKKNGAVCGGSLISPQWVLTAAHCVMHEGKPFPAEKFIIISGKKHISFDDSDIREHAFRVSQVIAHENYNERVIHNDIALLKLEKPMSKEIPTIQLADNTHWDEVVGNGLKNIGWGKTQTNSDTSPDLRIVDFPLINPQLCNKAYNNLFVNGKQLCAGYQQGDKGSCQGDSGGPLFRSVAGLAVQYGIVSYGSNKGCALANQPNVYTRVAAYTDWIKQKMGADANQLRFKSETVVSKPAPTNVPAGNRALLIGVKDYYLGASFNLGSPEKDVARMKQLLIDKFGFQANQIMTLTSEEATVNNIRNAVKQWLIGQSRPSDKVWLYYSGHGSYLEDTSGDESEIDAQIGIAADETILPYDTDILTVKTIDKAHHPILQTSNHLLDDEIHTWTEQLKDRKLTVMFDSCHSGTATRSVGELSRNGSQALRNWFAETVDGYDNAKIPNLRSGTTIAQRQHRGSDNKNMVFWSSAASSETALEDAKGGKFTVAFAEGANGKADKNGDGNISYAEMLSYTRKAVSKQTPQLEIDSTRLGESLFSGETIEQPVDVVEDTLPAENPHGVKMQWLDESGNPTQALRLCQAGNCPKYKLSISAQKPGLLLVYDLDNNGELQQYIPYPNHKLTSQGVYLNAGESFVFPIDFQMTSAVPSNLVAILLDPVEQANYDKIKYALSSKRHGDKNFFYEVLDRRDTVIGADGKPAPLSVAIQGYAPQ